MQDFWTEETDAKRGATIKQAWATGVEKAKDLKLSDAELRQMLLMVQAHSVILPLMAPLMWAGQLFLTAIAKGVIGPPCAGGCGKLPGEKFCSECGAKL